MKLYLISVCNLVVEVDSRYIKGMLAKPNLHPRASINRWILAILTFHFTLVHIPSTHHGPDRMPHSCPQPDNEANPPNDIDDWIDKLYGFMQVINTDYPHFQLQSHVAVFVSEVAYITLPSDVGAITSYKDVPRTTKAQLDDDQIVLVWKWLEDLQWPGDFSDSEYKSFIGYCMMFFLHAGKLWRKDPQQWHKLVATPASCILVLPTVHDDVAHKGFYATNTLIALCFWWPHM